MESKEKLAERLLSRSLTLFAVWAFISSTSPQALAGGVGDGGGSAVSCPGVDHLELTDINEARARNPELSQKFSELRKLPESEIVQHVAKNLMNFLKLTIAEDKDRASEKEGMNQLKLWLKGIHENLQFGQARDPKDSGAVKATLRDCVELRVAINRGYDVYHSDIDGNFGRLHMRVNKERWAKMPLFDQYGLIVHEILYAYTEGRVSFEEIDPLVDRKKTSEKIRHMVGLILSGKAAELRNPFDFMPWNGVGRLSCEAGSTDVHREDSNFDRIHFDLLPLGHGRVQIMVTNVYGVVVFTPNAAVTDLDLKLVTDTSYKPGGNPHLMKPMDAKAPFFPTHLAQVQVLDLGQSPLKVRKTNSFIRFFVQKRDTEALDTGIVNSVYLQFRQLDGIGNARDFNGYVSCQSPQPPEYSRK